MKSHDPSQHLQRRFARLGLFFAFLLCGAPALPQVLAGQWVERADAAIEKHRKTAVRVLVLNAAGEPAPHAEVHLMQLRHEFPIGFVVPKDGWPRNYRIDREVWRVFNTASLDRFTPWTTLEPKEGEGLDTAQAMRMISSAEAQGLDVWWGPVLSADSGRNPGHLVNADNTKLALALMTQMDRIMGPYGRRACAFDLYTNALDHDMIEDRLGTAMLRRMFERADAITPQAQLRIRLSDVMDRRRALEAVKKVTAWNDALTGFDAIAIDQRFLGQVQPDSVRLSLSRLEGLKVPLVFSSIEATGEMGLQAAVSLETVLRVLYASPSVTGVCLSGVTPADAVAESAALFDEDGRPTAAGSVVDSLFWKHWRTDETHKADRLGNVYTRVFPGTYQIVATLPDGTATASVIRLPRDEDERTVILQPNKPDRSEPAGAGSGDAP